MKISIITICRNNPSEMVRTINGYLSYLSSDIEAIIIDGSDNDSCIEAFRYLNTPLKHINFFKQTSKGLYAAMNEGIAKAKGDSLIFMNSGDTFSSSFDLFCFLEKYSFLLKSHIIFGNAKLYYKDYYKYHKWDRIEPIGKKWRPSHQAIFMPRSFLSENKFSESLKVSADTELQIKAFNYLKYIYIDETICEFELGGISSYPKTLKMTIKHCNELISTRKIENYWPKFLIYIKQVIKLAVIKVIGYRNYLRIVK
ncbi:glycosyltransferase [Providencia huaxiensis]|uniref:Glycosyltransferase n=2 Tax=Providencia huaxiensis TaxID=2027290 RepID=A0ABU2J391_9GAMM|nr:MULTISPECIES: glycosyltransferase [Providencia]MDT0135479.1 glycosyltransferase [Providencia huaxiensis]MDT1981929.1 glycosyltransferase [Providencia huaxiensis]QLR01187.1 glycosyltransferase [Providencia rettgeri]